MNKRIKIILIVLFLWMLFIFLLSSQNGDQTTRTSEDLAYYLCKWIFHTTDGNHLGFMNWFLRRAAHVVLYFVLGIILMVVAIHAFKVVPLGVRVVLSYAFFLFCCYFDEWHKQFISGRHNDFRDVRLNVIAGTVGVILTLCIRGLLSLRK